MENKIPTAKEYLGWTIIGNIENPVEELKLIRFAKLHVEAALKAAAENAITICDEGGETGFVDKDSILSSYPLENIK
jgi:hypothetical protein